MSRTAKRAAAALLGLALLTSKIPCHAAAPAVSAESYVLMDARSGRLLLAKNETQERAIASTTKIMTALLAIELGDPAAVARVERAHLAEGSSMYLREGETLTLEALLYGLMLPSGNDAAECIADLCGGRDAFLARMNEKAASLGMTHTAYRNPNGLDEPGHYSCALDLARLAAAAVEDPTFRRICSTVTASCAGREMQNHNRLLGVCDGCLGVKNGYTGAAGRTLVTCCERGGLRLIAVTLHDGSDVQDHSALYDYAFSAYRNAGAAARGERCAEIAVRGGELPAVSALAGRAFSCALAEGETLSTRLELPDAVDAPVREGDRLGELVVLLDGEELGRVPLLAGQDVRVPAAAEEPGLWARLLGVFGKAG